MEFWVTRDKDRDSLTHYGIKGQKHGVRNYQYEDGSLTPEGKARYGSNSAPRSRKRTTDSSGSTGTIKKGESVGGSNWTVTRKNKVMEEGNKNETGTYSPLPSETEYQKKKEELDAKDWLDVYDVGAGGDLHIKREDFADYIKSLIEKGISPKLNEISAAGATTDPEIAAEMQEKNALIRYWNEQVAKVRAEIDKEEAKLQLTQQSHEAKAQKAGKELAEKMKEALNKKKTGSRGSTSKGRNNSVR